MKAKSRLFLFCAHAFCFLRSSAFQVFDFDFAVIHSSVFIRGKVFPMTNDTFLQAAIDEARQGMQEGGIPIGSVVVYRDKIIGRGHNRRVQKGSAILHGEMDALENAGRQSAAVYRECVLYTTLSPCSMCSGAILLYGIPRGVIGENRTFMGEEELLRSRGVSIEVVQSDECIRMMEEFIRKNPTLWNEDIGCS
jgi:creatinine deaminase